VEAIGQDPIEDAHTPNNSGSSPEVLAVYQVLANRAQANRNLTWQIPALTLTSQAFLIGISAQLQVHWVIRLTLSLTILAIGAVSLFLQLKVGVYTILDLHMLDKYERLILNDGHSDYLLHHSKTTLGREREFLKQLGHKHAGHYMRVLDKYWGAVRPLRLLPLNITWGMLQVIISIAGGAIPLLPLLFR